MPSLENLKNNPKFTQQSVNLSKELSMDNIYKTTAWLSLAVWILISFFVSLAIAQFDFSRIWDAKFWLDFIFTWGGVNFLKFMFAKYGDWQGQRNPNVQAAQKEIEADNEIIRQKGLLGDLGLYVKEFNMSRKLTELRRLVYFKLNKNFTNKKKWSRVKESIKIYEQYQETHDPKLLDRLYELDFDLESYPVKYAKLKEESLRTGFSNGAGDESQFTYDSMYEIFGKNVLNQVVGIIVSVVLAATTFMTNDISLGTVIVFITRVALFSYNSLIGFTTAKYAVETIKLNVLNNIHLFLSKFIELNTEKEVI